MIKCGECGYENMDGLDYCDGCGAKLAAGCRQCRRGSCRRGCLKRRRPLLPLKRTDGPAAAEAPAAEAPKSEAPTGEIKPEAGARERTRGDRSRAGRTVQGQAVIVRGGPRKGQEFPLEDGNNLVGRWDPETGSFPEVDLDADDPEAKISRKHALIRIDGGKITIEDIGSLNGTYVNRQPRLSPGSPAEIKSGDEVIIGKTFLKLVVEPIS